jgi:hypothetical protein
MFANTSPHHAQPFMHRHHQLPVGEQMGVGNLPQTPFFAHRSLPRTFWHAFGCMFYFRRSAAGLLDENIQSVSAERGNCGCYRPCNNRSILVVKCSSKAPEGCFQRRGIPVGWTLGLARSKARNVA